MFINFKMDPCLCPHPPKQYFLIPKSPNLWHPTLLGHPFRRLLGNPLRHPCLSSTIQPSTIIHLLSPVLPTLLTATSLGPHPSDSALDIHHMSALQVLRRSKLLVTSTKINHNMPRSLHLKKCRLVYLSTANTFILYPHTSIIIIILSSLPVGY